MELKTVYFTEPGQENTEAVFVIVRQRAEELGIKKVLVASTSGGTAVRAAETLPGLIIIAVTHSTGFRESNVQEFTNDNRRLLEEKGGTVLTTAHAFAGISRAVRNKFDTYAIGEIIGATLRTFGDGMKVACEITLMATDSGLVRTDEDIITIGGTAHGADTALVLKPVNTDHFFDLKVKEILCKPRF
jgi:hypothetical protein